MTTLESGLCIADSSEFAIFPVLDVYPNPFNEKTTIHTWGVDCFNVFVFDAMGREVDSWRSNDGCDVVWNAGALGIDSGVYFLRVDNVYTNEHSIVRVVFEK